MVEKLVKLDTGEDCNVSAGVERSELSSRSRIGGSSGAGERVSNSCARSE